MLSKREKLLLNVLFWIVVAAGLGILFFLEMEKNIDVQEKIGLMEEQIEKYSMKTADEEKLKAKKGRLSEELKKEWVKFYDGKEIDPYRFGIIIRNNLVSGGLEIKRYQTLEVGGSTWLEFSVSGEALAFFSFLEKVSNSEKYWTVSFVSIDSREGQGRINAVFRISYETIDEVAR